MKRILVLLLSCVAFIASAQKKTKSTLIQKQPLTHTVYDSWRGVSYKGITNDGKYAGLLINPQDGDGRVVFYNFVTGKEDSVKRAAEVSLTFDSKHAVFKIQPPKQLVKDQRRQKKKKEDLPKDSLGIYAFDQKRIEKIPGVKSYRVPEKKGDWVAYLLEVKKEEKKEEKKSAPSAKTDSLKTTKVDSAKKTTKPKKVKKNSDENGHTLVLRKLSDGKEVSFGYVKDYLFSKFGHGLLFTSTGNDSTTKAGVYWYDLEKESLRQLHEGKSKFKYKGLASSEDGKQISFLVDIDTTKTPIRYFKLYHWREGEEKASQLADEKTQGVPTDWIISEHYGSNFSKDGSKLYIGISPKPVLQDTAKLEEEIVKVEVWGWKDDVLYTQQNKQADKESKRSYTAVINLADKKLIPLADKNLPTINFTDEGNASIALGVSDLLYRWSNFYDPSGYNDGYVVSLSDGSRKKVLEKIKGGISISPKAKYFYWFSLPDTAWFSYSVQNNRITALSKSLHVSFADEENDVPDFPGPYGAAGWTADDQQLLVYDRYDIWSFDPQNNRAPINLTKVGREQKIQFRYIKLDPEEKFIQPDAELLLTAYDETTKGFGYYKLSLKTGALQKLLMSPTHRYAGIVKAKNADRVLFTRENFNEFPDVWTSSLNFTSPKKITNANPQMKNYLWGSVELVKWTSSDGVPLEGLLYKPENFDPSKKYPMITYFYEVSSDQLNMHFHPQPTWSIIHRSMFVSNGYVVFIPDIVYKEGFPGESAYNCIMSGVMSQVAKGFIDEKNIGIQGQSWGGYQTAYLITRTNLFKAAGAGAPVVNMTSAYGGVRWGTGLSRMFQYERSQSRIGGTLWDKPLYYIENSPLFFADKIETPLLMTHNDEDGAVPWYQGIEFYMALRRLQKQVWLLVYNKEDHNLVQRHNRKDLSIRLSQFFDYYLKGAPMPSWMDKGIPAIEKGITTGY